MTAFSPVELLKTMDQSIPAASELPHPFKPEKRRRSGWVYFVLIILFFLHQDFWFWEDRSLVFGFIPIGLAYHAFYSISAGLFWFFVTRFAWPDDLEMIQETQGTH